MMEADLSYFTRRAAEEKAAANSAAHPNAREAHLTLAACYEDLAKALAESPQERARVPSVG
jgi:hypothetical protein